MFFVRFEMAVVVNLVMKKGMFAFLVFELSFEIKDQ